MKTKTETRDRDFFWDGGGFLMITLHPEAQAAPENPWSDSGANLPRWGTRVKVPFRLTRMNGSMDRPLLWLWSRRGRYWVIEQDLFRGTAQHKPVGFHRGN